MNKPFLTILNRAAIADSGWIHVVPKGELPNAEADIVQVLDDAALDSILAFVAAEKARLGDKWPGIYAGREHFIYSHMHDSAALAWFKEFEKRDDGIWANADGLTPVGQQAIANGEYKFTSFVANQADTEKLGGNRVRILKIDTIGFTNQANGKELLTPITNRESSASEPTGDDTRAAAEVLVIANRIKRDTGCSFERAWNQVRLSQPALFNRMAAQPAPRVPRAASAVLTNREQRDICFAADRLRAIASNRATGAGISFDIAWQQACRDFPDVNAKAQGRVFNRAQIESVSESDWKAANSRAEKVFSMLEDEATSGVDRGTFVTDAQLRGVFKRAIDRAMRDENMTRRAAFDQIKEDEPIFWARAMLDFEL